MSLLDLQCPNVMIWAIRIVPGPEFRGVNLGEYIYGLNAQSQDPSRLDILVSGKKRVRVTTNPFQATLQTRFTA